MILRNIVSQKLILSFFRNYLKFIYIVNNKKNIFRNKIKYSIISLVILWKDIEK